MFFAATRQFGRHQLPSLHRDHSPLSPHHGVGIRALQNSRHLHRSEDLAGRSRLGVHLSDIRAILRRGHRLELDGEQLGRFAGYQAFEACG